MQKEIIDWLLSGDVSIQYQTRKDILKEDQQTIFPIQKRIQFEGWGKRFLLKRNKNGHWGKSYYQPKWTSTHYTLLDLRNLECPKNNKLVRESVELVLKAPIGNKGGINFSRTCKSSDVCLNGMILNYCSYFLSHDE